MFECMEWIGILCETDAPSAWRSKVGARPSSLPPVPAPPPELNATPRLYAPPRRTSPRFAAAPAHSSSSTYRNEQPSLNRRVSAVEIRTSASGSGPIAVHDDSDNSEHEVAAAVEEGADSGSGSSGGSERSSFGLPTPLRDSFIESPEIPASARFAKEGTSEVAEEPLGFAMLLGKAFPDGKLCFYPSLPLTESEVEEMAEIWTPLQEAMKDVAPADALHALRHSSSTTRERHKEWFTKVEARVAQAEESSS